MKQKLICEKGMHYMSNKSIHQMALKCGGADAASSLAPLVMQVVPGDCVAGNRGADYVKRLAPALCAGTRHLTRWLSHACACGAASFAPR
ncbi:MAG: hypothetical protein MUO63_21470, partial [Desulfobulbaceae bacterium]|nr:hypothetical protein [Desulfobulbaceae bacterium]